MSDEEHILIKIQFAAFLIGAMAGVFLQIFIFKLGGLRSVILYNISLFTALLITYFMSGYLLRRISTKISIVSGLLLEALCYGLVLIFREYSLDYIFIIGSLAGIAGGFYWSGYNLSQYILTHSKSRTHFFSRSNGFVSLTGVCGPFAAGAIISITNKYFQTDLGGYYMLFLFIFCIYIYTIVLSLSLPDHIGIEFSVQDFFTHKRSKKWRYLLMQMALLGLYDVAFGTLSGIILFVMLQGEFQLGLVRTIIGLLSAIVSFYASRLLLRVPLSFFWGGLIASLGIILFGLFQNIIGILGLGLAMGVGFSYVNVATSTATLNAFDAIKSSWKHKYHLFIERDTALGLARIISYALLLFFFVPTNDINIARTWILFIAPLPLVVTFFLYKIVQ